MKTSIDQSAENRGLSRKRFFTISGLATIASGLLATKSTAAITGSVTTASQGPYVSTSFTGTLDAAGKIDFSHGLGASLPANILSVNAFIKLADGKVRNLSVEHVDGRSISVVGGVPNAAVKVGVVYSKDNTSW